MIKKTLMALAIIFALPFAFPPFRRGFVEGFREEWKKAYPEGVVNYIKNQ